MLFEFGFKISSAIGLIGLSGLYYVIFSTIAAETSFEELSKVQMIWHFFVDWQLSLVLLPIILQCQFEDNRSYGVPWYHGFMSIKITLYFLVRIILYALFTDPIPSGVMSLLVVYYFCSNFFAVMLVCFKMSFWRPEHPALLLEQERKLLQSQAPQNLPSGKYAFRQLLIARLGTVYVPYTGAARTQGDEVRTLVLLHGYGAGNGFWAMVFSFICYLIIYGLYIEFV